MLTVVDETSHPPIEEASAPSVAAEARGWDAPTPQGPDRLGREERAEWLDIRATVNMLARDEAWSMGEVSRRSGIPLGTFSPWYSGKYLGSFAEVTAKVRNWLRADEERRSYVPAIVEPGFVRTATAVGLLDALSYVQELPGVLLAVLGAGMGKTMTVRHAAATRPHVVVVTASPSVRTPAAINRLVAHRYDIPDYTTASRLRDIIADRLSRAARPLIVIDEAQNLIDEAVDELRYYRDNCQCGLALVGNNDVIGRWGGTQPREGYGQLHRRISMRLTQMKPSTADVEVFVSAWGITEPGAIKLLRAIGQKPGALGQVAETIKLAAIRARGAKRMIEEADIKWAWNARVDGVSFG